MTIQVNPIADLVVKDATPTTINLFNNFDDPRTTGLVAKFELYNTALGGGVTNVVLFDQPGAGAPLTVQNFQKYVTDGDYVNTIIHRSVPNFVVQGGGFTVNGLATVFPQTGNGAAAVKVIPTDPPVQNEFSPSRSNLRGTIAMAKLGSNPNSATSQWFFNLGNNAANLDTQNGGFTVFGEVASTSDLAPLDAIAAQPVADGSGFFRQGAFTDLPVIPIPGQPLGSTDANLVRYRSITIAQQNELTFTVVSNSNPDLVQPSLVNNQLVLNYRSAPTNTASVTIRATNLFGVSVEDTFLITVDGVLPPAPPIPPTEPVPTPPTPPTEPAPTPPTEPAPTLPTSPTPPLPLPATPTSGNDFITGTDGNDRLRGLAGNDRISGLKGADRLLGDAGADTLLGGDGNDFLQGGAGRDGLHGGLGSDRLEGGLGLDRIITGGGRDTIITGRRQGTDVVKDFALRFDKIQLGRGIAFQQITLRQSGRNTLVQLGNENLLVLEQVNANQVGRTHFV